MLKRLVTLAALCSMMLSCRAEAQALPVPAYDGSFWAHWSDGKAEVSGYDLVFPRYGELRKGKAVAIFVTETFSDRDRVKADPGKHPKSDEVPVMKLNLVFDFQTGIYDYNIMTSTFVTLAPHKGRAAGAPTKVSFSSQEWCGHVWHQLLFDERSAREVVHSYFDGEADGARHLERPADGVIDDVLWFWARGLASPRMAPGEKRELPYLPSLLHARLAHVPLAWQRVTLEALPGITRVEVPAGTFEVEVRKATSADGVVRTYYVEKAAPHRLVRFEASDGTRMELRGSERLEYWKLNHEGGERALGPLGLEPQVR